MGSLITPDNFEFFARYLLAGFIIMSVRARYAVGERAKVGEALVDAVILSLLNQLIFQFISWLASQIVPIADVPEQALFYIEVLVLPILLGFLIGLNLSKGWNRALLRRLSMPVQSPARRAYDHAFSENALPSYVILTYEDGTKVHGYYGEGSLAANDATRSDIYLERLYDVRDDGQWYEQSPSRSGLLMLNGLRSIEFLTLEETENAQERTDVAD